VTEPPLPTPGRLIATALYLVAWPMLVLLLSGTWRWLEAWLFGLWFVSISGGTVGWLYRQDPSLLAERYRMPGSGGQAGFDRAVVVGLVVGFAAWIVIMPLDAKRFGWTHLPAWLEVVGGASLLPSAWFLFRAFADNTFVSPLVRIQVERHHRVVSTGVYAVVRHPMYLGASLLFVGTPLLLGSGLGLALGAALVALLAVRIVKEEQWLAAQLDGYEAYRRQVRWRLIPFLW
jgi:protein-S-isoprenylcysteine O-methyltransferase Ste14